MMAATYRLNTTTTAQHGSLNHEGGGCDRRAYRILIMAAIIPTEYTDYSTAQLPEPRKEGGWADVIDGHTDPPIVAIYIHLDAALHNHLQVG